MTKFQKILEELNSGAYDKSTIFSEVVDELMRDFKLSHSATRYAVVAWEYYRGKELIRGNPGPTKSHYVRVCPKCGDEKETNYPPKEGQVCMDCHFDRFVPLNNNCPEDHRCTACGEGPKKVNFTISTQTGRHKKKCNRCTNNKVKVKLPLTADRVNEISDKFKDYFKENYNVK